MKKIIYVNPDETIGVYTPQLWSLIQLQRGREDYDPVPDMKLLLESGVPAARVLDAINKPLIDLKHEEQKMKSNGRDPATFDAYKAYLLAVLDGGKTLDEAIALIAAKDRKPGTVDVVIVDAADVPSDKTFRGAWVIDKVDGKKSHRVVHDMARCVKIKKDQLRALRVTKLAALDVEYQRADEAGDSAAKRAVAAKKQVLRDATSDPRLAAAKTPDELKAILPEALV